MVQQLFSQCVKLFANGEYFGLIIAMYATNFIQQLLNRRNSVPNNIRPSSGGTALPIIVAKSRRRITAEKSK